MSVLGGGAGFYVNMPDHYSLVVNTKHPLVTKILEEKNKKAGPKLETINTELAPLQDEKSNLLKAREGKKDEEIPQADKDKLEEVNKKVSELEKKRTEYLNDFGSKNKVLKQLIDLALLSNNLLKGEELTKFVKRSVELIK